MKNPKSKIGSVGVREERRHYRHHRVAVLPQHSQKCHTRIVNVVRISREQMPLWGTPVSYATRGVASRTAIGATKTISSNIAKLIASMQVAILNIDTTRSTGIALFWWSQIRDRDRNHKSYNLTMKITILTTLPCSVKKDLRHKNSQALSVWMLLREKKQFVFFST